MFNLKMKKISIIAGAIASAITLSTFSGFATGLPTEFLTEQIIGTSSSSEQKMDNSINTPEDFVNEEIDEDVLPQVIDLNVPGDYRLVGVQAVASTSNNQDPNARIVHINDVICIRGSGEYNITLDNVNIDIDDEDRSPICASKGADVNLILVGKNYLKNRSSYSRAVLKVKASLTIGASGEGASLDIYGVNNAIRSEFELTINGGDIKATSVQGCAIDGRNMTINGGDIKATSVNETAIYGRNMTINGGDIKATSKNGHAIDGRSIIIDSGDIKASSEKGHAIHSRYDMTINGGDIKATSVNRDAIYSQEEITINGGDIKAASVNKDAIYGSSITIYKGKIEATSVNGTAIHSGSTLTINGGKITSNFIKANNSLEMNNGIFYISKIESKNITIKGGDINKIKSINGIKYDFENSKYILPFYVVDTKKIYIDKEKNISENLWGAFKKSNNAESNKSKKTNSYFSDCQFVFN